MAPRGNLSTLAHKDCTASNGKWFSVSDYEHRGGFPGPVNVRNIYHYSTLMMSVLLTEWEGEPVPPVDRDNPFEGVILYEREGGSMSDKCGLSRIRQSLLMHRRP